MIWGYQFHFFFFLEFSNRIVKSDSTSHHQNHWNGNIFLSFCCLGMVYIFQHTFPEKSHYCKNAWKALEKPRGSYIHMCGKVFLIITVLFFPKFLRILTGFLKRRRRRRASVNGFADTFNYSSRMLCDNETGLKTDYYCYVFILFHSTSLVEHSRSRST